MGDLISKIPGLIPERFLVAYFIPLLVVIIANIFLFDAVFCTSLWSYLVTNGEWNLVSGLGLLLALFVIAYVAAPFSAGFRSLLEGQRLPRWIAGPLQERQHKKWSKALEGEKIHMRQRALFDVQIKTYNDEIQKARNIGVDSNAVPKNAVLNTLRALFSKAERAAFKDIENAGLHLAKTKDALEAALLTYSAHEADENSVRLGRFHKEFESLQTLIGNRIDSLMIEKRVDFDLRFSPDEIEPTAIGNFRAGLRHYAFSRYGLEFEIFWRHLVLAKAADEGFKRQFIIAENRLEFLINMLFLAVLHILIWPLVIAYFTQDWVFAGGMIIIPGVFIWIYYRSIVLSYRNFVTHHRSAIDIYRPDVFKALNLSAPDKPRAEKDLWRALHGNLAYAEGNDI